jgi:hypothetical protein
MKPISSYVTAEGITVQVYPEKKVKRNPYASFGGSIALLGAIAKRGIPDDSMFVMPTRRRFK